LDQFAALVPLQKYARPRSETTKSTTNAKKIEALAFPYLIEKELLMLR